MTANLQEQVVDPNTGKLTLAGIKLFRDAERDRAKLAAIAVITAPAGGATIDTEARTAIAAIIAAAG